MPPQNPQAVLRDSNGNRVGTFYRTANGKIALYNDTDGAEITLDASGLTVESLNSNGLTVESLNATSATVAGERPAGESELYTTPTNVGNEKNSFSLSRAGDLVEPLGAILPTAASIPSIIHASEVFSNPLGEWYIYAMMYSVDHRNHLFYADDITGPYTDAGVVLEPYDTAGDQAEGPSVHYVPEKNEVWMYYHEALGGSYDSTVTPSYSTTQQTYLATTPTTGDGSTFTRYPNNTNPPKPILEPKQNGRWDDNNNTYATMRRIGGQWYCLYRATDREANSVPFGYATSGNGINWRRAKYPPAGGHLHDNWTPNRKERLARLGPTLVELNGTLVVLWVQDGTAETRGMTWNQLPYAEPDSWSTFAPHDLGEGDSIDYGPYTYIVADHYLYRIDWRDY